MFKFFIFTLLSIIIVFVFPLSLFSEGLSEPIVVRLATESKLMPIYLAKIISDDSELSEETVNKLEEILKFDLNHNGMTLCTSHSKERDNLCKNNAFTLPSSVSIWKNHNVYYVIAPRIKGKKLSAHLFVVNSQTTHSVSELELTGNISQDRKIIHKLADSIHKTLFGDPGVASTHLLYTIKNKKGNSEVWEADYDGANGRQVTQEDTLITTPTYLPPKPGYTSGNFFYVSYKNGQPKIYISSLRDGKKNRLTMLSGNQLTPAVSRQRNKVAFISDITGNPDLFLQEFSTESGAIGKPRQIFTAPHAAQSSPSFNPEGSKVAFVSNKDRTPRIYTIDIPEPSNKNLKDIKTNLISKQNREATSPAWSPDGTKIAYSAMTNGIRQIWTYDFNTKQETQITQGPGNKENPSWAPNSLHLVFNAERNSGTQLFIINLNQTEAWQITSGAGEKRFPSWE